MYLKPKKKVILQLSLYKYIIGKIFKRKRFCANYLI